MKKFVGVCYIVIVPILFLQSIHFLFLVFFFWNRNPEAILQFIFLLIKLITIRLRIDLFNRLLLQFAFGRNDGNVIIIRGIVLHFSQDDYSLFFHEDFIVVLLIHLFL